MEWLERLNTALKYIEDHLDKELDASSVADAVHSSSFHFQRMFTILTGLTLAEYIRRRRLTLAAGEIQQGRSILETALKYGYDSQASFSRAFSRLHGMPPGAAREPGARLKAFPPMVFNLSIQGAQSMDYEIRDVGEFKLAGDIRSVTSRDGQNFVEIPRFWQELNRNGRVDQLASKSHSAGILGGGMVGACLDFSKEQEEFNYLIGMEPDPGSDLTGLTLRTIPPAQWAVFSGSGPMPQAIQDLWKRIFSEWFPATEYSHADQAELEVYLPMKKGSQDMPFEIWIPVEKK